MFSKIILYIIEFESAKGSEQFAAYPPTLRCGGCAFLFPILAVMIPSRPVTYAFVYRPVVELIILILEQLTMLFQHLNIETILNIAILFLVLTTFVIMVIAALASILSEERVRIVKFLSKRKTKYRR